MVEISTYTQQQNNDRSKCSTCTKWHYILHKISQITFVKAEYFTINLDKRELISDDGRVKPKNVTQSLIVSILFVRNSFIKKRLTTKSSEERSCFGIQRASVA